MTNSNTSQYKRNISELENLATKWWPEELKEKEETVSIIPTLLKTQDRFLSVLRLCDKHPEQIFDLIKAAKFPSNLFIKHLVILADYGGEPIKKLNANFESVFPRKNQQGRSVMNFIWQQKEHEYTFNALPIDANLDNKKLGIDGKSLTQEKEIDDLEKDIIMILLYGASSEANSGGLEKCEIGSLLGTYEELDKYVKQKYIIVSRITGGATANDLGQIAQSIVVDFLKEDLGEDYKVTNNRSISLDGYDKKDGMPFDVVVEKNDQFVGIEVSFQVTTNSTIERKSGQAANRQELMHKQNYKIAYVIDGAGNFERSSAISTICKYSDCTVAYTKEEFRVLAEFIRDFLG